MEDSPDLSHLLDLKNWAIEHGAVLDNVNFPVYFKEIKTFGITAKKNIAPHEALLYIPSKIIIDSLHLERAVLKDLYERNPELFDQSYEISLSSLTIYIVFEILKGLDSFWFPFLRLVSKTDLPIVWNTKELNELQDEYFIGEIIDERIGINDFYDVFIKAMKKEVNLGLFPKGKFRFN
jgi:hypothetical protein